MSRFIEYVLYNNERVDFDQKTRPILGRGRANPHFSGLGEDQLEKNYIEKMKSVGFNINESQTTKWLRSIFPEMNVRHEKVRGLAEFFAYKLGMRLGREIYRRRACLLYWIEERLSNISNLLATNTMSVCCNGTLYQMVPPLQPTSQITAQAQPAVQLQATPQMQVTTPLQPVVSQDEFAIFDSFENFGEGTVEYAQLTDDFDDSFTFDETVSF